MRPFSEIACEQRSAEWFAARCGRVTASCADDMLATNKNGSENYKRRDLRVRLVVERLTGEPQEDGFVSREMERGSALEPDAFAAYEAKTGELVDRVGFLQHAVLMAGCSPDGVLGDYDGLLELKVPKSSTHLRYWKDGGVPDEHRAQLRHSLFVSGAPWIDFASFDPRFPAHLQLYIVRFTRDQADLTSYEQALTAFLEDVQREYDALAQTGQVA